MIVFKILLISSFGILCFGKASQNLTGNPCVSKETCGDCLTADPECAWCAQEDFALDGSRRCDYTVNLRYHCSGDLIIQRRKKLTNSEEEVYDQFCECEDYSCDRFNGKMCGGPDHGMCDCGMCRCIGSWSGVDCSCSSSIQNCIQPGTEEICSGHGYCICNECKCHHLEEGRYSGLYCESCPTCPLKCEAFRNCVECQIFPDDNDVPAETCADCTFITIGVGKIEIKDEEKLCVFRDNNDCTFTFKYKMDDDGYPLAHAQRAKDCPTPFHQHELQLSSFL